MGKQFRKFVFRVVVLAVAAHSIGGGLLLLFFPLWTLSLVHWEYSGELFWPSQAGLFLILLGVAYACAVRIRALVWLLIASKASAVVFLLLSIARLDAPKVVLAMAVGDGLMGLAVAVTFWLQRGAQDAMCSGGHLAAVVGTDLLQNHP